MAGPLSRPDFRVVVRILEALGKAGHPLRPTQLQQASGTNYTQFQRYLTLLRDRGLVAIEAVPENDGGLIRLTTKGEEAHHFIVRAIWELLPRNE